MLAIWIGDFASLDKAPWAESEKWIENNKKEISILKWGGRRETFGLPW